MCRIHLLWMSLLLSISLGCTRVEHRQRDIDDEPLGPIVQESWDVELDISEDGVIRLTLDAAYMARYDDPDSLYTTFRRGEDVDDRVTAVFYDSLGALSGTMSAERVRFNERDNTMIATGDVVVESDEGRLESEEVHWDEESGIIEAPGFVSLISDDRSFSGYDLEANEDLSQWEIRKPTGTFTIEE